MLKFYVSGLLLAFVLVSEASVFAQCVPEKLKVTKILGRVVYRHQEGEEPFSQALVELLEDSIKRRTLAQTTSDGDGSFSLDARPGTYILRVSYPDVHDYFGEIEVVKSAEAAGESAVEQEIVITLGSDFGSECGGSYGEVRKRQTN